MPSPATTDKGSMLPPPPPTAMTTVEYKKDGTISRMRSHRGNVPQLPQTKLCPFCPARFTRTTHLNRHLRNHTNERLYRCEICGAQFTRSDLLARHKRSCGESHPISRSRKRSCQACTSLKVKCDLRQPCTKCRARGRDCVYATEEGQRDGAVGSFDPQQVTNLRPAIPVARLDASAGFDPSALDRDPTNAFSTTFPELSLIEETSNAISQPLSEANLASFMGGAPQIRQSAMSLPTIDTDSDITGSSFRMGGPRHAFTTFGASDLASHPRALRDFSPTMFQPFFRDVFSVKEESLQENEQGAAPLLDAPDAETFVTGVGQPDFTQSSPNSSLDTDMNRCLMSDLMSNVYQESIPMSQLMQDPSQLSVPASSSLLVPPSAPRPNPQPMYPSNTTYDSSKPPLYTEPFLSPHHPIDIGLPDPSTEEFQYYLLVFLTAFLPQIPVIHIPTLRCEIKPQVFIRAMQACGAIFVKTPVAQAFVEKMLGTRRELIRDFEKPSPDPLYKSYINITLLLLQTIGLFHQDPQQRAQSSINHGIVVEMVRQTDLIGQSTSWVHRVLPIRDPAALDAMWHEWAIHETIKRLVCLAYCHDQAYPIYFSRPPLFSPEEFVKCCLPCDDELWAAKTSLEWSQLLLRPSSYGSIEERLYGVPMLHAFAAVGLEGPNMTATTTASPEPPKELNTVSPFGHYILLQSLLGELFRRCTGADSPAATPAVEEVNDHVLAMQLALHRWLQMWQKNPNAYPQEHPQDRVETNKKTCGHFMADPLPFYWLAQLLLLAFQDGLPPFYRREATSACPIDSSNSQGLNEPSPFAPSTSTSTPFSPSVFAPSPFSGGTLSSGSSPVSSNTPPPAYWSLSAPPPPAGTTSFAGIPGTGSAKVTQDTAQFYLVKRWLHYIRLFLRRNQGTPTIVWDELMKIRLSGWLENEDPSSGKLQQSGNALAECGTNENPCSWLEGDDGLIGFFEEKLQI